VNDDATSEIDIDETFAKLVQESKVSNMSINAKNTKLMVHGKRKENEDLA